MSQNSKEKCENIKNNGNNSYNSYILNMCKFQIYSIIYAAPRKSNAEKSKQLRDLKFQFVQKRI